MEFEFFLEDGDLLEQANIIKNLIAPSECEFNVDEILSESDMIISIYDTQRFLIEQDTNIISSLGYEIVNEGVISAIGKTLKAIIDKIVELIKRFINFITGNKSNNSGTVSKDKVEKQKNNINDSITELNRNKQKLQYYENELKTYEVYAVKIDDSVINNINLLVNPNVSTQKINEFVDILERIVNLPADKRVVYAAMEKKDEDAKNKVLRLVHSKLAEYYNDMERYGNNHKSYIADNAKDFGLTKEIVEKSNEGVGAFIINSITANLIQYDQLKVAINEWSKDIPKMNKFFDDCKDIDELVKPLDQIQKRLITISAKVDASVMIASVGSDLESKTLINISRFMVSIISKVIIIKISLLRNIERAKYTHLHNARELEKLSKEIEKYSKLIKENENKK